MPALETLLDQLRRSSDQKSAIKLITGELLPKLQRMTKVKLAEMLGDAVFWIYHLEIEVGVLEGAAEHANDRRLVDRLTDARALRSEAAKARKENAIKAADALHSKPGASRDKWTKIRKIWASGKYHSRDECAEKESAILGMSCSTARKALRNTPDPSA